MDDLLKSNEEYLEETCSVCGRRLTKYGNKQLKDGILCRSCAIFSSPFLRDEDFAEMTVEDVKKHLEYRRENAHKLESFKKSVTVEGRYDLYIDEESRNMVFSKKRDLLKENPDIIPLDSIKEMSIIEEQYLKEDGVDVLMELELDSDEVKHVGFRINEFPGINNKTEEYRKTCETADAYLKAIIAVADMEEVL
ncbi:MAG: DUF4428 domain-containing protein [Erysipelotrichaceae bacterium]|nr:DUF4428 domain-containing protein [Erysipelotrichaceae bacterium]